MYVRLILLLMGLIILLPMVVAQTPNDITIVGTLYNSGGSSLAVTKTFIARIYDAPTGGTQLHSTTASITTESAGDTRGQYNLTLSNVQVDFNQDLWLEMNIGGETLSPRIQVNQVPNAFLANSSIFDANTTLDQLNRVLGNKTFFTNDSAQFWNASRVGAAEFTLQNGSNFNAIYSAVKDRIQDDDTSLFVGFDDNINAFSGGQTTWNCRITVCDFFVNAFNRGNKTLNFLAFTDLFEHPDDTRQLQYLPAFGTATDNVSDFTYIHDLNVDEDFTVDRTISCDSPSGDCFFNDNLNITGELNTTQGARFGGDVNVSGQVTVSENLTVDGGGVWISTAQDAVFFGETGVNISRADLFGLPQIPVLTFYSPDGILFHTTQPSGLNLQIWRFSNVNDQGTAAIWEDADGTDLFTVRGNFHTEALNFSVVGDLNVTGDARLNSDVIAGGRINHTGDYIQSPSTDPRGSINTHGFLVNPSTRFARFADSSLVRMASFNFAEGFNHTTTVGATYNFMELLNPNVNNGCDFNPCNYSTLYIGAEPNGTNTGTAVVNNYALLVEDGTSQFDGGIVTANYTNFGNWTQFYYDTSGSANCGLHSNSSILCNGVPVGR